ncbi:MAG: hypothetical protein ACHQ9S_07945 [Candidatus Binatia bacterium]
MKLSWMGGMSIIVATVTTAVIAAGGEQPIKDPDGKVLAAVVACDACESGGEGTAKACSTGAEEGWLNGKPCGKCMLTANLKEPLAYPYDLHMQGKLVDGSGKPVKERFVKMFLPNGWTVRTRTFEDGTFHVMLGATEERKSKTPVVTDLGTHVDSAKGTEYYALFMLPGSYKPCSAEAAKPVGKKQKGKKH